MTAPEPRWLSAAMVVALQGEAIAAFGGSPGIRDQGLLESAIDRPRNLFAYGDNPSIFDLAAAYCLGLVRNHPFIDGNKRVGLLAANAFLDLNTYKFSPREVDAFNLVMAAADGRADHTTLAGWFRDFAAPKSD